MGVLSDQGHQGFVFGGDGGSAVALSTRNDSVYRLDGLKTSSVSFEPVAGDQPMRRIHASLASRGGYAYVIGGEKADGSGLGFDEVWQVSSTDGELAFRQLPSLPTPLSHHQSIMLSNGTLLVIGGWETRIGALASMSTAWTLDTTSDSAQWESARLGGSAAPIERRGHSLVLIGNNDDDDDKALLFGGSSSTTSIQAGQALRDLWELDFKNGLWKELSMDEGPSARLDASVASVGGQMVVFGGASSEREKENEGLLMIGCLGYGADGPADTKLYIHDVGASAWVSSFAVAGSTKASATATATQVVVRPTSTKLVITTDASGEKITSTSTALGTFTTEGAHEASGLS